MHHDTRLVIFDLFGTLVKFGVMRHPFRKIMHWARTQGRQPQADDARKLMTINSDHQGLFLSIGIDPPAELLEQLECDIQEELDSLQLFEDVNRTLNRLAESNIPVAICSNLAKPYGVVIKRLLPSIKADTFLSYEVGCIKPDRKIYELITNKYHLEPEHCLFIGDTLLADYEGPKLFGFQARHLVRDKPRSHAEQIATLEDLALPAHLSKSGF